MQDSLFPEFENEIEKEWKEMPEFIQDNQQPIKQLIISFKNWDDYKVFAKIIEQPLTAKTQSVWFPKAEIETYADKCYVDEKTQDNAE